MKKIYLCLFVFIAFIARCEDLKSKNSFFVTFPHHENFACTDRVENTTLNYLSPPVPCTPGVNTPTVSISASSSVICSAGPQATLTANSNGNTYSWNTGSTASVVITSTNNLSGAYYEVVVTNTLSGCSTTASIQLTLSLSPTLFVISNKPHACLGETVILTGSGNSQNIVWNTTATGNSINVSPTLTSVYSATGSNVSGCTAVDSLTLTVYPLPVLTTTVSPTVVCVGEQVNFYAGGASSYTWMEAGGASTTSQSITVKALVNGSYTLVGMDANGCKSSQNFIFAADECTGLKNTNQASEKLTIYPNPGPGIFDLTPLGEIKNLEIILLDLSGVKVGYKLLQGENNKLQLDITDLASGIYLLQIQREGKAESFKIRKE